MRLRSVESEVFGQRSEVVSSAPRIVLLGAERGRQDPAMSAYRPVPDQALTEEFGHVRARRIEQLAACSVTAAPDRIAAGSDRR